MLTKKKLFVFAKILSQQFSTSLLRFRNVTPSSRADVYIETRFIENANSFVQNPADAIIFDAKFNTELVVRELIFSYFFGTNIKFLFSKAKAASTCISRNTSQISAIK